MGSFLDFDDLLCVDEESDEKYEELKHKSNQGARRRNKRMRAKERMFVAHDPPIRKKPNRELPEKDISKNGSFDAGSSEKHLETAEEQHDLERTFPNDELLCLSAFMELDSYEVDSDISSSSPQSNVDEEEGKLVKKDYLQSDYDSISWDSKRVPINCQDNPVTDLELDYDEEEYPEISAEVDEDAVRKAASEAMEKSTTETAASAAVAKTNNEKKKEKISSLGATKGRSKNINGYTQHSHRRSPEEHHHARPPLVRGHHSKSPFESARLNRSGRTFGSHKSRHSSREKCNFRQQLHDTKGSPHHGFSIYKSFLQPLNSFEHKPSCSNWNNFAVNGSKKRTVFNDSVSCGFTQHLRRNNCSLQERVRDQRLIRPWETDFTVGVSDGEEEHYGFYCPGKRMSVGHHDERNFQFGRNCDVVEKETISVNNSLANGRGNILEDVITERNNLGGYISASNISEVSNTRLCKKGDGFSFLLLNYDNTACGSTDQVARQELDRVNNQRNGIREATVFKSMVSLKPKFDKKVANVEDTFGTARLSVTLIGKSADQNARRVVRSPLSRISSASMIECGPGGVTSRTKNGIEAESVKRRRRWIVTTDLIDEDDSGDLKFS